MTDQSLFDGLRISEPVLTSRLCADIQLGDGLFGLSNNGCFLLLAWLRAVTGEKGLGIPSRPGLNVFVNLEL